MSNKSWKIKCFTFYGTGQRVDLLFSSLLSHWVKRRVFTLQSIRHSRPSWTMRSPGACRKWGRKWRSWMLSFSSPLSLDLDLGLIGRGKCTEFRWKKSTTGFCKKHFDSFQWIFNSPLKTKPLQSCVHIHVYIICSYFRLWHSCSFWIYEAHTAGQDP